MEKLFICITILCSLGYISGLCWDAASNDDIQDAHLLYTCTTTFSVNKSKTAASGSSEEDISTHRDKVYRITHSGGYDFRKIIYRTSHKYSIAPSLISAVIKVESDWDSQAVSHKGAMGLMQLMPSTAKDMNVLNPFDPEDNIEGGTRYLRYLLDKFDGNLHLALAAYNAGPGTIEKFRDVPPFKETQQYVKRILSIYHQEKFDL